MSPLDAMPMLGQYLLLGAVLLAIVILIVLDRTWEIGRRTDDTGGAWPDGTEGGDR